jgi:GMP synthase-like glutamine amidotransferase
MKSLRFHIIQHVPFEGAGYIGEWIDHLNYTKTFSLLYESATFPSHHEYDVLIIMGGPMGVNDEDSYTWLSHEKKFIGEAISLQKKIIGICLGSQLIANVLGAKVYPNYEKEIGFMPIIRNDERNTFFTHFPDTVMVFHWHGDTFDLPENAVLIASSEACINQAYIVGNTILGLQFHLEVTEKSIADLIMNGKPELIDKPYIQKEEEIITRFQYIPTCHLLLESILDEFISL